MTTQFLAIVLGSLLLAIGINGFIVPFHLMDGGMIGVGLLAKYMWGFETGLTILLFSIPIYVIAFIYYRPFFYTSLNGLLISSLSIDLLKPLDGLFHVPILYSAIIGGMLIGAGIGVMLRFRTSTGGFDLLALFIASKTPLNVGIIIFIIDATILFVASRVLHASSMLYSIITICSVGVFTSLLTFSMPKVEAKS
jgi:uncharacterized membrane-anchored protein YitT (DUF2179 family)